MSLGKIFMISGPAGVGKTTVSNNLIEKFHGRLRKIITATTRLPRVGESDGIDYCFVGEDIFLRYLAEDRFLEYANVHKKYYYGTPIAPIISNIRHGIDSILIIDVQGVQSIKKYFRQLEKHMTTIFLMPESLEVLTERLISRGISNEDLARRLKSAKNEIMLAKNYDYIVLSGTKREDFLSMEMIYGREHNNTKQDIKSFKFINDELQLVKKV